MADKPKDEVDPAADPEFRAVVKHFLETKPARVMKSKRNQQHNSVVKKASDSS